ncbi:MAG: response regulator [Gemmataceae bacterium]
MNKSRILVVEDEAVIRMGIENDLHTLGYEVAGSTGTGEQAVPLASRCQPDLVLMDIALGAGMDGIAAARAIQAQQSVPVVFLTAHSDQVTLDRAKLTSPFGYITKPYEHKDLQVGIEMGLYRFQVERQLKERGEWLAAMLAGMGDGVIGTDRAGKVSYLNSQAEQLTGWPMVEAQGRDCSEVFALRETGTHQPVPCPAGEAMAQEEIIHLEADLLLIKKSGEERLVSDSAAPIRDLDGKIAGAVVVFHDVTNLRRLEHQAQEAIRLEGLRLLTGGIAHEFNNAMTSILGFSELILADPRTPPEHRAWVQTLHNSGQHVANLTQQMLAFGRKQVLTSALLNLNNILQALRAIVLEKAPPNVECILELAAIEPMLRIDPGHLMQALVQIIDNALLAMPDGGTLVIGTERMKAVQVFHAGTGVLPAGSYVVVRIVDTGHGMTKQVLSQAMQPFFSTRGVGKGTGLGLPSVQGFLMQSGGQLALESEEGQGTTVRIFLPEARVDSSPDHAPAAV